MAMRYHIDALLADLGTIIDIARAGVLSKSESRLESGEVRPAAILFIDIVGFSAISKQLEPEQLAKLIDSSFRIFELTAKSFGGYLDKVIGDAGLYVFAGHPHHAPPCEAALSAALKIQDRAQQISRSLAAVDLALPVRCGVAFGEVAKQVVGGEEAQVTVMGDAVNLAQRLESIAKPGTVLTHDAVISKAGPIFRHEELGERELKGVGTHGIYEVSARLPRPATLRGSYSDLSPFVGREQQLEEALDTFESWMGQAEARPAGGDRTAATGGSGRLLVVQGEQAVGKSRFALELVQQLKDRLADGPGLARATAHCSAFASPLSFTAELARVAGLSAGNLEQRWAELCALAAERVGEAYAERQRRHLSLLAYLLEAPGIDTAGIRQSSSQSFEMGCRLALRACCELADLEGRQVLLVIEDVQWLGGLRPLLADVLQSVRLQRPLAVIATARPEFDSSPSRLDELLGATGTGSGGGGNGSGDVSQIPRHKVMVLPLLSAKQGRQLIQRLLPGVELPEELEAELHDKAAGLPYYYEEFARMLADSGILREAAGGPAAAPPGSETAAIEAQDRFLLDLGAEGLSIPDDIRMLLLGRLDLLAPACKELAMRASVLGRKFSTELLRGVEARLELGTQDWLADGLNELEQAGILARSDTESYLFEHVMTREAAYDSLLSKNRRLVHGAAADALSEQLVPGSPEERDLLPQLVDHYECAERYGEAHDRCCELMILLAQSGRTENWDVWDAKARELQAASAEIAEEADVTVATSESALYLRAVGIRRLMQGEYADAKSHFANALELAQKAGDFESTVRLMANLAIIAHREGEFDQAKSIVKNAIRIADRQDLHDLRGTLHANIGKYEFDTSNHHEALEHYEIARELHAKSGNLRGLAAVQISMMPVLKAAGRIEEADRYVRSSLRLSQQLVDRLLESSAWTNLGAILHREGKLREASELYQRALEVDTELNRREWMMINLHNMGEASFDQGDCQEAAEFYSRALALAEESGSKRYIVFLHCAIARATASLGHYDESLRHLDLAQAESAAYSSPITDGVIHCCRAYYYLLQSDAASAEACLGAAKACSQESTYAAGSQLGDEIKRVERILPETSMTT